MKRIMIILLACLIATQAFALDFGFDLSNQTILLGENKSTSLLQANGFTAWLDIPLASSSSLYLSAVYNFYGLFNLTQKTTTQLRPYSITAGRFEWYGKILQPNLSWGLGRTYISDYSGNIFAGLSDGFKLSAAFGNVSLSTACTYTGLTYKEDANILLDNDDVLRMQDKKSLLAPYRLVTFLGVNGAEIFKSHDLGLDIVAQFDLEKKGDVTHTQYIEPYIGGNFSRYFSWKLWTILMLGQDPKLFYGLGAGFNMQFFRPDWLNLNIVAALNWAGGDYDKTGPMRAFLPITRKNITAVSGDIFSDTSTLSLDASIRPIKKLLTGINTAIILGNNNTQSPLVYKGSEISAKIVYNPFSDLDLSVFGGIFIPKATGVSLRWLAGLSLTLSF